MYDANFFVMKVFLSLFIVFENSFIYRMILKMAKNVIFVDMFMCIKILTGDTLLLILLLSIVLGIINDSFVNKNDDDFSN